MGAGNRQNNRDHKIKPFLKIYLTKTITHDDVKHVPYALLVAYTSRASLDLTSSIVILAYSS